MESKVCMNGLCGASSSVEWKRGWPLRSGQFAILCDKCGVVYEQLVFCDVFHSNDTGWRECTSCGKRLHCGCIASSSCLELLDSGGIRCISCTKSSPLQANASHEKPEEFSLQTARSIDDSRSTLFNNQSNGRNVEKLNPKHLRDSAGDNSQKLLLPSINNDTTGLFFQMKQEEVLPPRGEAESMHSLNFIQSPAALSMNLKSNLHEPSIVVKDAHESLVQTNLTISLAAPSGISNPFPDAAAEEMELNKPFSFLQHGSKSRHLLPKPPKPTLTPGLETNSSTLSQIRVARPPVEGRVKNQLLPRYWPRITDQELQQISGDSNSAITPLFEKVLSASDAGRIGRLVLPKACAEAYFPPISQPEGLPLKIQDVKGKEWVFQFRFWPNNNSRMYVLEGVTPCIQSMQLQAGDTVTFSRLDPGGKLLMGYRKASNTVHVQSLQGSTDPYPNALSKHLSSAGGDLGYISEKYGGKIRDGFLGPSIPVSERKRSRNIGSKSKRLLIDGQDALELKLTWEEIQDMLRPPPCVKPSTTTIEEHEFEEYGEPPVFGKRSIFTICLSGEQEQWTQCDCCLKWRRLPADFLLPPKWSCQENIWDRNRCLCSSPDELNPRVIENLLKLNQDLKRRRIAAIHRPMHEHEPAYLHSLANIVALGDNTSDQGATPVATTTKHPRHRPGCSCIVCIQPPSGKGKHKPTCTCNVCMTVKRRFKTLMMRKKKRQSDREAEIAQRNQFMWGPKEEVEVDSISQQISSHLDPEEHEARLGNEAQLKDQSSNQSQKFSETEKGHLDLNCHPDREELHMGSSHVSMTSLLQVASLPLETYLKQNGLTSLIPEQQTSSGSQVLPEANGQSEVQLHDDHSHTPQGQEEEKRANEDFSEPDHSNDTQ